MPKLETVKALEEFGRTQLSKSFFMREFLYSEISQIYETRNIPDDPDLAIAAGKSLCEYVLEPIQDALGRISVRSAYRSSKINELGNVKGHSCGDNKKNYAGHIWDRKDSLGFMGATACVIVTSFIPYYEATHDWPALAWWIHDHIPGYANIEFFPKYAAFNITWSGNPIYEKYIWSYAINPKTNKLRGYLTKAGMDNFSGRHDDFYQDFLQNWLMA